MKILILLLLLVTDQALASMAPLVGDSATYRSRTSQIAPYEINEVVYRGDGVSVWVSMEFPWLDGACKVAEYQMALTGEVMQSCSTPNAACFAREVPIPAERCAPEPEIIVLDSRPETIQVLAGTFDTIYTKFKYLDSDEIYEKWQNYSAVQIRGGIVKESSSGGFYSELKVYKRAP